MSCLFLVGDMRKRFWFRVKMPNNVLCRVEVAPQVSIKVHLPRPVAVTKVPEINYAVFKTFYPEIIIPVSYCYSYIFIILTINNITVLIIHLVRFNEQFLPCYGSITVLSYLWKRNYLYKSFRSGNKHNLQYCTWNSWITGVHRTVLVWPACNFSARMVLFWIIWNVM